MSYAHYDIMTYVGHNIGVKRIASTSTFMPITSKLSKLCYLIIKVYNAVMFNFLCIFENFLGKNYAAWGDPK